MDPVELKDYLINKFGSLDNCARKCCVSKARICHLLHGRYLPTTKETWQAYAQLLEVDIKILKNVLIDSREFWRQKYEEKHDNYEKRNFDRRERKRLMEIKKQQIQIKRQANIQENRKYASLMQNLSSNMPQWDLNEPMEGEPMQEIKLRFDVLEGGRNS